MRKLLTILLASITSISTIWAYDAQIGDLYYYLNSEHLTAVVTYNSDYVGLNLPWKITNAEIPESVTYEGQNYSVISIGVNAFSGCTYLTSVTIPNSVTSIGERAFYGCTSLSNVTMGNSVTSIGSYAFWGCRDLTSVTIPNSVTSIGDRAFYSCKGMTSMSIPNSVTNIGIYAFSECSGLANVTIGNSVTSIKSYTFNGCIDLKSVNIPESVTNIDDHAFYNCTSLTSAIIGNSVTSIGNYAFSGCKSLISITIPENVTIIRSYVLSGCSSLTSVTIPNSVTSIDDHAFYNCSGLTSVNIGTSVTSIGGFAFSGCSSLTSVTIPSSVTSIGNSAFSGCTGLSSVTIGDSVTSVGDGVFAGCKSLTSPVYNSQTFMYLPVSYTGAFTIPDGIEHIAGSAFKSHSGLTEITIPASVTSIEAGEFYRCTNLTAVNWNAKNCNYLAGNGINDAPFYYIRSQITSFVFGEEVESIPDYLCYGMEKLTSITLPQSVTSIGNSVFKGCTGLTMPVYNVRFFVYMPTSYIGSYIIDAGIETIASGAFEGCIGLSSVDIPNSVTSIGNHAFRDCTSLTSVTIPNSVTSIGKQAFYNCSGLTSVTVGNSVTSIGNYAFSGCSGMINVTVFSNEIVAANYSSNYSLKNIFGTQVTIYIIGESVTNIGNNAFSGCKSLTSVTIPNSIKSIGESAFSECSGVTSIDVPESVESIDADAFAQIQNVNYTGFATGLPWGALNVNGLPVISTTKASEIASGLSHNVKSSQPYYITGKVTSVSEVNTNFGNASYYITDGTTNFYCYRLFNLFGTKYTTENQINVDDEVTIFAYLKKYNTTLEAVEGYVVSTSGPYFVRNNFLYSLLSETETSIQYIGNTSEFTEVTIPSEILYNGKRCQITHIGNYAFSDCSNLKHVEMPDGITNIGTDAFKNCKALTNIEMPKSVANIGDYAFSGCTGLTSIELPEAITNIGKNAFNYCTNMPSVILRSETPPTLGEGAFNNCTALTDIYVPCGTLSAYTQAWQNYSSLIKYQPTEYAVDVAMNIEEAGSVKYPRITCDEYVLIATPNYGYHFVQWNDGNTDNPRAIEITQDAAYIAEFAIDRSGTCGDDNLLTWKYDSEAKLLTISGEGTLNSNYTYGVEAPTQVESLIIGSGVTSIGDEAFKGFSTLKSVELSSTVTTIGNSAFENCSSLEELSLGENITKYGEKAFAGCEALTSIYNYRSRPAKLGTDAFKDVDYFNCTLYVLAGSVDMYKSSGSDWKDFFFIEPIGAESIITEDVKVTPHDNTVDIIWPSVNEANTYEIEITKDSEVFCKLVFNAQGQLSSIAFAPSRTNVAQQTQATGFSFTVTGLTSGTKYGYTIAASNSASQIIDTKQGSFTTTGGTATALENASLDASPVKVLRNGQIFILRGGKTFTLQGQEVR